MPDLSGMPCWFLGANAPKGYFSRFDQLFSSSPEGRCFLLKGGPGTGKSTVLKKIAAVLKEKDPRTELIFCSADTDSLDAVITSDGAVSAADATLPHAVEPKYPGTYETVINLSDCWNEKVLREHAKEISVLFDTNRHLHEEARRYISAAANLLEEASKIGMESLYPEKTEKAALRLCLKEFGRKKQIKGTEKQRFLSAITGKGVFFFEETPKLLCKRIYMLDDEPGAFSRVFLNVVRRTALEYGLDIITCRCPVFPLEKIEHIFIPELELGFVTGNKRHRIKIVPYRTIHSRRFTDPEIFMKNKMRMKFALRQAANILDEAVLCLDEAKRKHDELEKFYIPAMDFSKVNERLKSIILEIK